MPGGHKGRNAGECSAPMERFSLLGQAMPNGPIRRITTNVELTRRMASAEIVRPGTVFYYDDTVGVRRLGRIFYNEPREEWVSSQAASFPKRRCPRMERPWLSVRVIDWAVSTFCEECI